VKIWNDCVGASDRGLLIFVTLKVITVPRLKLVFVLSAGCASISKDELLIEQERRLARPYMPRHYPGPLSIWTEEGGVILMYSPANNGKLKFKENV